MTKKNHRLLEKYSYGFTHSAPRNVHLSHARKPFCIGVWNTKAQAIRSAVSCLRRFGGTARVFHAFSNPPARVWQRGREA